MTYSIMVFAIATGGAREIERGKREGEREIERWRDAEVGAMVSNQAFCRRDDGLIVGLRMGNGFWTRP